MPDEPIATEIVETPQPEKKPKRKYLTPGEHHFLEGQIENAKRPWHQRKSQKKIALEAGYSPNTSPTIIKKQILEKINANEFLVKRLAEAHLGIDSIVDGIKELRECTNDKGNPDNDVRFRTVQLQTQIHGAMPAQKIQVDQRKVVLNITPEFADSLKEAYRIRGVDLPIEIGDGSK